MINRWTLLKILIAVLITLPFLFYFLIAMTLGKLDSGFYYWINTSDMVKEEVLKDLRLGFYARANFELRQAKASAELFGAGKEYLKFVEEIKRDMPDGVLKEKLPFDLRTYDPKEVIVGLFSSDRSALSPS